MVRFVLVRLAGVVLVVVATAVFAFGGLRAIREGIHAGFVSTTLREMERALLHLQVGPERCFGGSACEPVHQQFAQGWTVDVTLLLSGLVLAPLAGLAAGSWAVARGHRSVTDGFNAVGAVGLSLPPYLLGYGILLLFDGSFGALPLPAFFPVASAQITLGDPLEFLRVLAFPALAVALPGFAICFRLTVASAKDAADEDWVRTAIAKGMSPARAIAKHTRPVAAVNVVSFVGASVPFFVTNLILLEYVLNVPGFFKSMARGAGLAPGLTDPQPVYPVIQGVALWAAFLVAATSVLADLVLYRLDPRVRARSG